MFTTTKHIYRDIYTVFRDQPVLWLLGHYEHAQQWHSMQFLSVCQIGSTKYPKDLSSRLLEFCRSMTYLVEFPLLSYAWVPDHRETRMWKSCISQALLFMLRRLEQLMDRWKKVITAKFSRERVPSMTIPKQNNF